MSTRTFATVGLPVAAVLGSVVSLCVGSSFAKTLFPVVGATGTASIRLAVATLLLVALWRPWRWRLRRPDALNIALYGVVLGLMNLLFYMAIARIPLGLAIAIEFTGPLVLAIAVSRRAQDFVWIACAVLGLALLLPVGPGASTLDPLGVALALGAGACWALYIVAGQRLGGVPSGQATSIGMAIALIVVAPFGAAEASPEWLKPSVIATGLAVGILSSAVPYSLEMVALRRLPKQTFSVLLSLEPAVGALAGLFVLGEVLTAWQWVAVASVIVASAGSALTAVPAASRASTA